MLDHRSSSIRSGLPPLAIKAGVPGISHRSLALSEEDGDHAAHREICVEGGIVPHQLAIG